MTFGVGCPTVIGGEDLMVMRLVLQPCSPCRGISVSAFMGSRDDPRAS